MNKLHKLYQDINHRSNSFENYDELVVPTSCEVTCKAPEPEPVGEPFYINLRQFRATSAASIDVEYVRGLEWNDFDGIWIGKNLDGTESQTIDLIKGATQTFTSDTSSQYWYMGVIVKGKDLADAREKAQQKYLDGALSFKLIPLYGSGPFSKVLITNDIIYYTDQITKEHYTISADTVTIPGKFKPPYDPNYDYEYRFDGMTDSRTNLGETHISRLYTPQRANDTSDSQFAQSWSRDGFSSETEWVNKTWDLGLGSVPVESPVYAEEWCTNYMQDKEWYYYVQSWSGGYQEGRIILRYKPGHVNDFYGIPTPKYVNEELPCEKKYGWNDYNNRFEITYTVRASDKDRMSDNQRQQWNFYNWSSFALDGSNFKVDLVDDTTRYQAISFNGRTNINNYSLNGWVINNEESFTVELENGVTFDVYTKIIDASR